ncbi:LacI family DNA-binding transcriptional regulator [Monashia sp. NPDC004114]
MTSATERPTLATVAASAGVSIATVSKVINGRADVAAGTRARIQELLRQHEYVVRRQPPAPDTVIEVFFQDELVAYSTEILNGVLEAATDLDVAVVVSVRHAGEARFEPADWARDLAGAGRTAVVAVTGVMSAVDLRVLSRAHVPIVVIDGLNMPHARVTSVGSTNFAGGVAATEHLISLGHKRIAYIAGPQSAACNQARMHGFRAAMHAAGLPVIEDFVRSEPQFYPGGVAGATWLLERPDPPTAIFAFSDEMALGVLEAARSRGMRVPEDLSVVGFDDTQMARVSSPPLTTVRQPLRQMGAVALRSAVQLGGGAKLDYNHVELATELVVRGSTAPIAGS